VLNQHKEWRGKGIDVDYCAIGSKGWAFLAALGGNVVSQVVQLGDRPRLDKMVGPVKVLLDQYYEGRIDEFTSSSRRSSTR
jgi:F-type H+-transporting ATPase subunit gamma